MHRVEHALLVGDHVEDQPVVEEPVIREAEVQGLADEAVGAVGADHVAGTNARGIAGFFAAALQPDAIFVLAKGIGFPATNQANARDTLGNVQQTLFQVRLVEPVAHPPAGRRGALPVDDLQVFAVGIAPVVELVVVIDRRIVVGVDPETGEDPRDLMVEGHGTRTVIGLRPALHQADPVALPAQQNCQQGSDRTGADDRYIRVVVGGFVAGVVRHLHCHCCRSPDAGLPRPTSSSC
ncbi:hypothetical protein D3C76_703290 [compost metagenome]